MLDAGNGTLYLNFKKAFDLQKAEHVGKQDPYVQFSLDFSETESFQKTFTHEDAGEEAVWNQSFEIPYAGQPKLYVEIMDQEKATDEVIGFATIPLDQVQENGGAINGLFEVFNHKGEDAGHLHLTISLLGSGGFDDEEPRPAESEITEGHVQRVKHLRHRALAGDVGEVALAGGLAVGLGLFGRKLYGEYRKKHPKEEEA
ncbi:C2 domain-containing protein [Syncephalastrum racemosum]|uniref:C2 domain-containing protein n=1 Tax=Syncephalastrum racemosum TaxID=13706 RepID=A0A1X2HC85_SYNRA|nr:C2 domain-containing protein [Syncephalastrum racemosum]